MSHTYASQYPPDTQIDNGIKAFFEEFYKTSDTPDAHEKYADSFTSDATLVIASKKGIGRDGNCHYSFSCSIQTKIFLSLPFTRDSSLEVEAVGCSKCYF
jgi:hypothetical protein